MTEIYFAYGSNMSTRRLQARVPDCRPIGTASLVGWRLTANKRGVDGSGKANLVKHTTGIAWGVLFELSPARLLQLDRFEPGYSRSHCQVETAEESVLAAHVYLAIGSDRHIPPFDWYHAHLLDGAREHGLPDAYVQELTRWEIRSR